MTVSKLSSFPATDDLESRRMEVSRHAFSDETQAVQALLDQLASVRTLETEIVARATDYVNTLRDDGAGTGVEAFLHEYGLDTNEGIAVMCLAEALLRIPDSHTADRLIRDTFEDTQWEQHLGNSDSLFVNASSWGLMLTGKVVNLTGEQPVNFMKRMVGKVGDPVIRESLKKAMRFIGHKFVMGETIKDAISNAASAGKRGYRFSYDILGEGARTEAQAEHYIKAYHEAIAALNHSKKHTDVFEGDSLSIKISALHPRYSLTQHDRVLQELLPRLRDIMLRARDADIMIAIDAEEASRLDISLILFTALMEDPAFKNWNGIGFVVQAYQKRAIHVIDYLAELARVHGRIIPLRLVKGAYWDSEIKWAQLAGLENYPVFTRKEHTDVSYLACAQKMLQHSHCFYAQFATHNARTIASIMSVAKAQKVSEKSYEFQRLHGMGEKLHDLVLRDVPSRVYAPVGEHKDLLAYLIRRLLENGANTSFVNLLMDAEIPLSQLLADPTDATRSHGITPNPMIPAPKQLYGDARSNSAGIDFGNLEQLQLLEHALKQSSAVNVPTVSAANVDTAMHAATRGFHIWRATPTAQRAAILRNAADLLEERREFYVHLLAEEAGKTLADGIAEVREAADFCRYYATEAEALMQPTTLVGPTGESNVLSLHPRGVFACISPWNFPLAIFVGQVVAALATGNAVIAKPAEQTPRVAQFAVGLLREAGVPADALQCLIGDGSTGAALVAARDIAGVVFTGSVETAKRINMALASKDGPIVPLIAETGGQNVMVVDSSALLEAAVDDIVLSAFGSAGQRCSALRVLMVQEEIADDLITILIGAMQQLRIGNPIEATTDIGPVIDTEAQKMLQAHIARMSREAKLLASSPLASDVSARGHFVAPHAFEITSLAQLPNEVFGPILHVLRFKTSEFESLAAQINGTGYGLTFGLHSRIEAHANFFASQVAAGNIYINRSMTGATVGVQPFGGEGLSGTGPKAGGPHYLQRFVTERTCTINTAALGGNVALLSSAAVTND
jgi:RHH-type proline utilization regulon transcriptional repressor/proline dehydrogenase/delta 1-pyrroline-5-carboxylate dehydrogenase